jgi:hypothetical protein
MEDQIDIVVLFINLLILHVIIILLEVIILILNFFRQKIFRFPKKDILLLLL